MYLRYLYPTHKCILSHFSWQPLQALKRLYRKLKTFHFKVLWVVVIRQVKGLLKTTPENSFEASLKCDQPHAVEINIITNNVSVECPLRLVWPLISHPEPDKVPLRWCWRVTRQLHCHLHPLMGIHESIEIPPCSLTHIHTPTAERTERDCRDGD